MIAVEHPPAPFDQTVNAGGNTWFKNNQGSGAAGCLTGTFFVDWNSNGDGINLFDWTVWELEVGPEIVTVVGQYPPGPQFGLTSNETIPVEFDRNYSVLPPKFSGDPRSEINFGSDCLP